MISKFNKLSKTSQALVLCNFIEPFFSSLVVGTIQSEYASVTSGDSFAYNLQTSVGSTICLLFALWSVFNIDSIIKRFWTFITLDILSTWAAVLYFALTDNVYTYWPLAFVLFPKLFQSGINYAFLRFNFTLESQDTQREFFVMLFCLSCTLGYTLGGNLSFCVPALGLSTLACAVIYALGNSISSLACVVFIKKKHLTLC